MALLQISTLGPLQITHNHAPVSGFLSDKVRALLVYLAAEQSRPLRRETLANLMWPNQPNSKARANLRRALANLRQVIRDDEGSFLQITRQTLQFNSNSDAQIDAVQFVQLLAGEPTLVQMETAVALVNGRFLDGFSINDSLLFEEWALLKREEIQRQLLRTLHLLTTHYENHHQPETAVRYAWQMVQTEPWYELGQRQLLHLLAQIGQRATALSQYEQFQAELQTELGVPPEPATCRLYEQIRDTLQPPIANDQPPFLAEPHAVESVPFVARESELTRLHDFLATAVSHQAQFAFITGEAGSGKTSLLHTFARQAQRQHPRLIPLFGSSPAHVGPGNPYYPIRALLAHALGNLEPLWRDGSLSRSQASRLWSLRHTALDLLQKIAPDCLATLVDATLLPDDLAETVVSPLAPPQEILFEQIIHFLQQFSQHGPLLLLIDDLQWADSGTLDLLFQLRHTLTGYPILLLGAYRPETLFNPSGQHPLAQLAHELTHDFGPIELALNQANGRQFIDAWLDREPNQLDETFRQTLFSRTRGHALFTVELVNNLQNRGDLVQDGSGRWQASQNVRWEQLPAKTEAIIAQRVGCLPAALRQLLGIASIQGETFAAEIVAQVSQQPLDNIIRTFSADLSRHHKLIQPLGRQPTESQMLSRYRFRHNLFQQYVYGRLDPIERAHLHQRTGETMVRLFETAVSHPSPLSTELATHFEVAQLIPQAITYRQLAGQHALRLSAHHDAIAHYRRSLTLLTDLPPTPDNMRQEIECQLALGAALLAINGYTNPEVKATYDRAYELCHQVEAAPELVTSLFWLTSYYVAGGALNQAVTVSEQMLAVVAQHPVSDMLRMLAHVLAGLPHFFLGHNRVALAHFRHASAIYDPPQHQPLVYTFGQDPGMAAMMWQGHVLFHQGCFSEASRCVQQALAWANELDHPYTKTFIELLAGYSPNGYYLRQPEAAKKHVQTAVSLAEKHHFTYLLALANFYLGFETAVTQPHSNDGFSLMEQGIAMEKAVGACLGLSSRYLILAEAHRQLSQLPEAWQAIHQARAEAINRQELYFTPEIERVAGELHLLANEPKQAEICWQKAIQLAQQQEATCWELRAVNSLCRFWHSEGQKAKSTALLTPLCTQFKNEYTSPDVEAAHELLALL